ALRATTGALPAVRGDHRAGAVGRPHELVHACVRADSRLPGQGGLQDRRLDDDACRVANGRRDRAPRGRPPSSRRSPRRTHAHRVDELSYRKHHKYVTIVTDHVTGRVVWTREGKNADTLKAFFAELGPERSDRLEAVTIDMSKAYISAVSESAKNATIIFDRFHVQRLVQDALDEVRRAEVRAVADDPQGRRQLKHTRYALLKNPWNLSAIEDAKLTTLPKTNATLYRAYLMKESFTAILDRRQQHVVRKKLEEWTSWAMHSGLKPFAKVARTVRQHLDGIVAYVATGLSNARSEGTNGKVRTITRRSYGLHSASALIALIHLCCSGLTLQPAHTTPPFHQT